MARKYLNDIGIEANFMNLDINDGRWKRWEQEIEEYGFPSFETWCLDTYFYCWLYERLKKYLEVAVDIIDLDYYKFTFEGTEYTQRELVERMIHGCELFFAEQFKNKELTEDEEKAIHDVPWIWATVLPVMWW